MFVQGAAHAQDAVLESPAETALSPAESVAGESRPIRRDKPAARTSTVAAKPDSTGSSWLRTTVSLGGVVAFILFLAWGYRAVTGGGRSLLGRGRRPGIVEILSRTSLSPRQSLCLVRIGPRAILIGVTGEGVRTLDVIDDPAVVAQLAGQATGSEKTEFTACLNAQEREFEQAERSDSPPAEDAADAAIRTLALKRKLADASSRLSAAARV